MDNYRWPRHSLDFTLLRAYVLMLAAVASAVAAVGMPVRDAVLVLISLIILILVIGNSGGMV